MAIKHAIWTVGAQPNALPTSRLPSEAMLETMIIAQPSILSPDWMIIGQQIATGHGGRVDLLAIAPDASLVLIELKRDRTPREVVAQALDYASWVKALKVDQIIQIYGRYSNGGSLSAAFMARFHSALDEDSLNESHQIILVAAELDGSTERIVNYLNGSKVPINVVFFQVFQHGEEQLLSRAWMIDPGQTQVNASASTAQGEREPWNGEFYVSFGDPASRSWNDARKYGFVSAGGGPWYSRTLKLLQPGNRIWVRIPQVGYVGVGIVEEAMQSTTDFFIDTPEGAKNCTEVLQCSDRLKRLQDDPEQAEYFVKVRWLQTVDESRAFNEAGLFANQNTVCQPTSPTWRHTVERLKTYFGSWDAVDFRNSE